MRLNFKKVSIIILSMLSIFLLFPIFSMAGGTGSTLNPDEFKDIGKIGMEGGLANAGGKIIYIVQYVGYTVAVLVLISIGVKYMMSSPNEKADLKSRLIPYTIGAIILFAGSTMLSILYNIITG